MKRIVPVAREIRVIFTVNAFGAVEYMNVSDFGWRCVRPIRALSKLKHDRSESQPYLLQKT